VRYREEAADHLSSNPSRWNGPIPFVHSTRGSSCENRENTLTLSQGGLLTVDWYLGDYAQLDAALRLAGEGVPPDPLTDTGLTASVVVAAAEGWLCARRSDKVSQPGFWQHAVSEGRQVPWRTQNAETRH
jgi:hypothetical protein